MEKYVHFIGICGTAMAPAAKIMRDMGWNVSGSDKGFYPPISDYLRDNNLVCMPGFKASHITNPDLVVVGNAISLKNIELEEAKRKGIPIIHYPKLLQEFLVKEHSVVVAGTYGKTTTTALITWILECAQYNPSYMIGGVARNFSDGIRRTDSTWSVIEGDEYNAAKYDLEPKFIYYNPLYVILSSASWDHVDLYPTLASYIDSFKKLVDLIPPHGALFVKDGGENLEQIIKEAKCPVIPYSHSMFSITPTQGGTDISYGNDTAHTALIGYHNMENVAAAFSFAKHLSIPIPTIMDALSKFQGVKRRLEVRGVMNGITVIDDLAHSAIKAKASLKAIHQWYPNNRIWAVFEPHSMTARTKASMEWFKDSFISADFVIIGDIFRGNALSEDMKASSEGIVAAIDGKEGEKWAIKDTDMIVQKLATESKPGDIIVFMSSGGFGGVIQKTLDALTHEKTH